MNAEVMDGIRRYAPRLAEEPQGVIEEIVGECTFAQWQHEMRPGDFVAGVEGGRNEDVMVTYFEVLPDGEMAGARYAAPVDDELWRWVRAFHDEQVEGRVDRYPIWSFTVPLTEREFAALREAGFPSSMIDFVAVLRRVPAAE